VQVLELMVTSRVLQDHTRLPVEGGKSKGGIQGIGKGEFRSVKGGRGFWGGFDMGGSPDDPYGSAAYAGCMRGFPNAYGAGF